MWMHNEKDERVMQVECTSSKFPYGKIRPRLAACKLGVQSPQSEAQVP